MVQLSAYGSALLLAEMDFYQKHSSEKKFIPRFLKEEIGDRGGHRLVPNPEYVSEDREVSRFKRWENENKMREFTIEYLKTYYPNTDYVEKYEKENKWNKPLMFPTEESKKCEYLHEDGRHCTMKRNLTSCYTCCFVCFTPAMCGATNCPLLPEDRKPKHNEDNK